MKLAELWPAGKNGAHLLKLLHLVQGAAEENVRHLMGGANLRKFGPAALLSTVGADDHPSFGSEFGHPFLIVNTASNKLSDSADPWSITLEANEELQGFHDWTAEVLIEEQLGV